MKHLGKVDYLVNLACTYLDDGFKSSHEDRLQALDVNLVSAVELTRAFYEDLKINQGTIVNFTSISAKFAQTGPLALSRFKSGDAPTYSINGYGFCT